jgi:hypothetical protein
MRRWYEPGLRELDSSASIPLPSGLGAEAGTPAWKKRQRNGGRGRAIRGILFQEVAEVAATSVFQRAAPNLLLFFQTELAVV